MKEIKIITEPSQALEVDEGQTKAERVFDLLDVSETSRADYKYPLSYS